MSNLFEPKSIGTLEMPNRFVRSATAERLADDKGARCPNWARCMRRWREAAWGWSSPVTPTCIPAGAPTWKCRAYMTTADRGLEAVADAVHEAGGKMAMQINHGGRQCDPAVIEGRCWRLRRSPMNAGRVRARWK